MIANRHKKSTMVWIAGLISMLLFFVLPAQTEAAGFTKAQTGVAGSLSGAVDTALAGLYELTYTATDAAGNVASVSRVVTVLASSAVATSTPAL